MPVNPCYSTDTKCIVPDLISHLNQGIIIIDEKQRICHVNQWLCQFVGYEQSELLSMSRTEFIKIITTFSKEVYNELDNIFKDLMEVGKSFKRSAVFVHKNGSSLPVLLSANGLTDSKGRVQAVLYMIDDAQEHVLSEITKNLHLHLHLKEVLDKTIELVVNYLGLSSGAIFLYEESNELLRLVACNVFTKQQLEKLRIPLGEGAPGKIASMRKPMYIENLQTNPNIDPYARKIHLNKSSIGYPMIVKDHLVGVIAFDAQTVRKFSLKEKKLFSEIADLVGAAIYNAQMFEYMEKLSYIDDLTGLFNHRYFQQELSDTIASAYNINKPVSLLMIDIDHFKRFNDTFGHMAGDRLLKELAGLFRLILGAEKFIARYGGEEFAVVLPGATYREALKTAEKIRETVHRHPFEFRGKQAGNPLTISIGVASFPEHCESKNELISCADLALYTAKRGGRNRAEGYFSIIDELYSKTEAAEHDTLKQIRKLLMKINNKDDYTFHHSERVSIHATIIAEAMGLNKYQCNIVRYGAYLHDIGKIKIPRNLLVKNGPLTQDEFKAIREHTKHGYELVKPIKTIKECLPIILYHHERYDGHGYPSGLKGEEIPLFARIVAAADSYDAMTSQRPYQSQKSFDEAIMELTVCAGNQFDPEVVKTFVALLRTKQLSGMDNR
ncbi:diguanylate cyclase [Metallumcola ferriviriculae]|uniref:Diguanylate cyclase n=1 Tax=Metallumcola ferriviriculae TaxID=3039180 RepID=A0AAU0UNC5_9FIRM|nr:diguanylate cyclase [Desulfitibacteraceae bacterium MK1]